MTEGQILPLGARGMSTLRYPGIRQTASTCVFASIGGAVNHLAGRSVWTEDTLLNAAVADGAKGATFGYVVPTAVRPVADDVDYKEHLDEERNETLPDFLRLLREHVNAGGLAIVSLEKAVREASGFRRQGEWHMVTLIASAGDLYHVWDSNGVQTLVTEQELLCLKYPNDGPMFIEHDKHHALMLWRKPSSANLGVR